MVRTSSPVISFLAVAAVLAASLTTLAVPSGATARTGVPTSVVTVDTTLEAQLLEEHSATAIISLHEGRSLDGLDGLGLDGARLEALSMLVVDRLTGEQLARLREHEGVRSVWGQQTLELHMQESTWVTGARDVWENFGPDGVGYTGEGVELAVVDTGADGTHADFGNLIEFCNASATGTAGLVVCTEQTELAHDDNGHGTHVAGTMAGTGAASGGRDNPHATIGMAPDAKIRSYAANVAASLLNTDILAAYDDLIERKLAGEHDIVAINNSFGGGIGSDYSPDDPQAIAYQAANEAGMLPVFSAGNSGPDDNTLGTQCLSPYVLCVGASTKTDGITAFSSVGRPAAPLPGLDAADDDEAVDGGEEPNDDGDQADSEIAYDNHDRRLAREFGLGVYRPGIVAPGAVINAMMANAPCKMGLPEQANQSCYEPLQGTSMSAPHVTGAAGLVVEAFRDAHDRTPSADELLDILERSAAPLPGHSAEQQGVGRLDVPAAVELALTYDGDGETEPAWLPVGTPHPAYEDGRHPGGDTLVEQQVGCTGPGSYTLVEQAGITTFEVPAGTHELTVDVDWGDHHPEANLYLELFRPGHDPANSTDDPGPSRTFPVAESAGLVHTDPIVDDVGPPATSRSVAFAAPEDGEWSLRVTHRLGATPQPCGDTDNTEESQQPLGFRYDVEVHATQVTDLPEAGFHIDGEDDDSTTLRGTSSYPDPLEGVTTWAAPGSGPASASNDDEGDEVETTDLYLTGDPDDVVTTDGGLSTEEPDGSLPVVQSALTSLADPDVPSNPLAITFTGDYTGSVNGDLAFDWYWVSPNPLGGAIDVEAVVTVFADPDPDAAGEQPDRIVGQREVRLSVLPGNTTPAHNETRVPVRGEFEETLQVQVTPVFVDTGPGLTAVYGAEMTPSKVAVPQGEAGGDTADLDAPDNVRITDRQDTLRVAWDPVEGAEAYEVHRSTDPGFALDGDSLIATTPGDACRSPNVAGWSAAGRDGLCLDDTTVTPGVTHYYRVVALDSGAAGEASLLGYGTPTVPERQARVQVDRIHGPGYWEVAEADDVWVTGWTHLWDRQGVTEPADPRARVFSQGVGSLVVEAAEEAEEPQGPEGSLEVTPGTVSGPNRTLEIDATAAHEGGTERIEAVTLTVTGDNGRVSGQWGREDFTRDADGTLSLRVEHRVRGPAPWTIRLVVTDDGGDEVEVVRTVARG